MELDVRKSSNRRRWAAVPAIVALAITVAACGGSSGSKTPKAGSSATPKGAAVKSAAASLAPGPKFTKVLVTATDFKFVLDKTTGYTPGNYTFSLKNNGKSKHAVEMNGPELKNQVGATVATGQSTDLVVPLVKGTYEVWSPVGTDKAKGMYRTIVVS